MRTKTLLAGGAALAWMLLAQPALGATVGVFGPDLEHEIRYEAAVGELNAVSIVEAPDGVYMITDLNAAVTPLTPECASISPNTVRCDVGSEGDDRTSVFTKDAADSIYIDSYGAFVHGGAGPDTLTGTDPSGGQYLVGGLGDDRLVGLAGTQIISGGKGADSLAGGRGDDELEGGAGTDVIAGGPGKDTVSYLDHSGRVRISLDGRANDGALGEHDWVRADVESANGSFGPTTFIGNAGSNTFLGFSDGDVVRMGAGDDFVGAGRGSDVLSGGAGDDYLNGANGRDLMLGGPGDDVLDGFMGADVIRGGRGNDFLDGGWRADILGGGRGRDHLVGGPHNDTLRGGPGRDRLLGDSGADVFYARDRNRERVDGGPGEDRARVDPIDGVFSVEVLF